MTFTPMTVELAKREITAVLAALEGTGVVVEALGVVHETISLGDRFTVHERKVLITLRQPLPVYPPFQP